MNILVVSYEAWRDTNNGGNVLSNIFGAFEDAQIAQIYCSGEEPQNSVCRRYFQISESMLLKKSKGRRLEEKDYSAAGSEEPVSAENKIKSSVPAVFKSATLFARELLWTVMNWRTEVLREFVTAFQPDIIFAPCYQFYHVSKVALYAQSIAKCPMISYISDDNYSLRQIRFYPSFWINRLITRKWIRRLFAASSLIYTMTRMQKVEYEKRFGRPMKILCKSAPFERINTAPGDPVSFIYAGSLQMNRWKVLTAISDALASVNEEQIKAQLHIFSGTAPEPRWEQKLNDGKNSVFHGLISFRELEDRYKRSDVAIFAESFDLKNRLLTRLSFSTKIIDCLDSGCAVLAVGPAEQGGMQYLKENDAAICVNDLRELPQAVRRIALSPELIVRYAEKANHLGKKNHMKAAINEGLRKDFDDIAAGRAPAVDQT